MKKLKQILSIVVLGFLLAVIYHYIADKYLNMGWPFNTFLFNPKVRFTDFTDITEYSQALINGISPYKLGNSYMPFSNWLVILFSVVAKKISLLFYFAIVTVALFLFLFLRIKNIKGISKYDSIISTSIIVMTSFPLFFTFDRGNFEGICFCLVLTFILLYGQKKYLLSIIPLAMSTSFKPFAIVFFILFLVDKKYIEALYLVLLTAVINFFSLLFMPEGLITNIIYLIRNLNNYNHIYINQGEGVMFNHSFFNGISLLNSKFNMMSATGLKIVYFFSAILVFALIFYIMIKFEVTFTNKVLILIIAMISFPFVVPDYTLIYLYIPLGLLLIEQSTYNKWYEDYEFILITLISLILIPKQYFVGFQPHHAIGPYLNAFLFMVLIIYILKNVIDKNIRSNNPLEKV